MVNSSERRASESGARLCDVQSNIASYSTRIWYVVVFTLVATVLKYPVRLDNYRTAMLAIFKYLALLRASSFPPWYQREMSTIKETRFRFSEKRRPDDYAVWVSEHMAWPVPRDLILSAPQLVQEWDERDVENDGEKGMRKILNSLRVERARAVLMAQADQHARVGAKGVVWEKEPWYGTPFRVERFDEQFIEQVSSRHFYASGNY